MSNASEHLFGDGGKYKATVPDDVGNAAVDHMQEMFVVNEDLTAETIALVAKLFAWCRAEIESGSRPIPIQQALRIASDAMADPGGVGITPTSPERNQD